MWSRLMLSEISPVKYSLIIFWVLAKNKNSTFRVSFFLFTVCFSSWGLINCNRAESLVVYGNCINYFFFIFFLWLSCIKIKNNKLYEAFFYMVIKIE